MQGFFFFNVYVWRGKKKPFQEILLQDGSSKKELGQIFKYLYYRFNKLVLRATYLFEAFIDFIFLLVCLPNIHCHTPFVSEERTEAEGKGVWMFYQFSCETISFPVASFSLFPSFSLSLLLSSTWL